MTAPLLTGIAITPTGKRSRLRCLCEGCETVRLSERRPHQPRHRLSPGVPEVGGAQ